MNDTKVTNTLKQTTRNSQKINANTPWIEAKREIGRAPK